LSNVVLFYFFCKWVYWITHLTKTHPTRPNIFASLTTINTIINITITNNQIHKILLTEIYFITNVLRFKIILASDERKSVTLTKCEESNSWPIKSIIIGMYNENYYQTNHHKHSVHLQEEWYLYNQFCTTLMTTTFLIFLLDKNNGDRKRKRENKNTCEYEIDSCFKSCQKIDV